ncbi:MAG: 7TM diverse intracellular signaling domain-containing protein, partial [Chitinophagaceae bacterium]
MRKLSLFFFFLLFVSPAFSQQVVIDSTLNSRYLNHELYYFEDPEGRLAIKDVLKERQFIQVKKDILNLLVTRSVFWIRFTVHNRNSTTKNLVEVVQPLLTRADFFEPDSNNNYIETKAGQDFRFLQRAEPNSANFAYPLNLKPGETKIYFLRISSKAQMLIPIHIVTERALTVTIISRNLWFGIYCGIIIVMVLYNLFIFFSIRDKSSLYYVLHTLFVGLTQATLVGYTYKYLWPENIWFGTYSTFLLTCLVSIVGVQFLIEFMRLKQQEKKLYYTLKFFQVLYVIYIVLSALGFYTEIYGAILATQIVIAFFIVGASIYLLRKGYSEAKFYLIGWFSLMTGIVIYVLKDMGLIDYNPFTAYSLLYGSAAEVTLLSFALADKINIYKLEKEKSQEKEILAVIENERIVREQNVMLESMVNERTHELRIVNDDLVKVLKDLKDAEGQLVE